MPVWSARRNALCDRNVAGRTGALQDGRPGRQGGRHRAIQGRLAQPEEAFDLVRTEAYGQRAHYPVERIRDEVRRDSFPARNTRHAASCRARSRGSLPPPSGRRFSPSVSPGCSRRDSVCRHTRVVGLACRGCRRTRYRSCDADSRDDLHRRPGIPRAGASADRRRYRPLERLQFPRRRRHRLHQRSGRADGSQDRRDAIAAIFVQRHAVHAGSVPGSGRSRSPGDVRVHLNRRLRPQSGGSGAADSRLQPRHHAKRSVLDRHRFRRSRRGGHRLGPCGGRSSQPSDERLLRFRERHPG